jgi:adenylate cyclase
MVTELTDRATRRLVAVNADIVGFSRLMADDAATTEATVEGYRRLVETKVEESSGTLVNFVGDNFMAVFDDATDAMAAAIAISSEIEAGNAELPPHRRVRFRIGIDQGDVSRAGDRYFGDALNIAARIQQKAPAGGISVSGRVFRALDEPALRFKSMGRTVLKNIPEPVDIFDFADLPGDLVAAGPPSRSVSLDTPTMVVLPIHSETVGGPVQAIADVVRSDLLHRLAAMPRLTVIDGAVAELPSREPAQYMLETGIHQIGDQVRVYAKVIHVATMNIVTSHKWAASVDELFALSDTISHDVSHGIAIELVVGEQARLYSAIGDPETTQQIYQGWYQLTSDTYDGWLEAVRIFEGVARSHPEEVYGHSLSAFANWVGASSGFVDDPEPLLDRAFAQASVVLDQGDPTGLAHMVHGAVYMARGRPEDAVDVIEHAQITRPTCDVTYALEGSVRRYLGHWEKAIDLMDTAIRLSAVPPPWYPTVMACSMFMGGRLETAGATAETVVEHNPHNLEALLILAAVQQEQGLERRARATADLVRDRFPAADIGRWLDAHPFKDSAFIDRWRDDLVQVGLVAAEAPVSPPA